MGDLALGLPVRVMLHKGLIHKLHSGFVARKAYWTTPLVAIALWAGILLLLAIGY